MDYTYRIEGTRRIDLAEFDPDEHGGLDKKDGERITAQLGSEMEELLELLTAAGQTGLLVIVQGRDTSGKDGLIRHFLHYANVQSCQVIPFKVPTETELRHDFLWRIHAHTPGRGAVSFFNRSHYEDVLAVRVHQLAPEEVWKRRYDHINHFESLLADSNTIVLKFFLHISKGEQKERLLDREKDPEKAWKLNVGDWKERELWDEFTHAYEDALTMCGTSQIPWYLVPANHKWFRNLAVTETIVETLRPYRSGWLNSLQKLGEEQKTLIEAYRKERGNSDGEKGKS